MAGMPAWTDMAETSRRVALDASQHQMLLADHLVNGNSPDREDRMVMVRQLPQ